MGKLDKMRELAERDMSVFSGYSLERYFQWKFAEEKDYTRMGGWWDRKGENEIDLLCENEYDEILDCYEVKTDKSRFDRHRLENKFDAFLTRHPEMHNRKLGLFMVSLADM